MSTPETHLSLIERVQEGNSSPSWAQFFQLYEPLLRRWVQPYLRQPADADDCIQDVLLVVVEKVPRFVPSGHPGGFRCWLRTIMQYRLHTHWRAKLRQPVAGGLGVYDFLQELADANSELARRMDEEHDRYVVGALLNAIKPEFATSSWEAFWLTAIQGVAPAAAAATLGMSQNAVYIARSRILARLRQEARGLLDR
jgi:RNA polymerase sigma-70 factor (ECF subfamily)